MKLNHPTSRLSYRAHIGVTTFASALIIPASLNAAPFRTFDNGGGNANFGTAANWDSNTVPGANEGAVINVFSPNVTLLITSDQTVDTLRINDGRTVTQTGGTLTIANAGTQFERGLWIGEFGGGNVYNMNGGAILINDDFDGIILGKAGGADGTMNFTSGTITNTAGDTFIGADQNGTWNQSGGTFTAGTVYLARWGSPNFEQGFVNLNGGIFAATRVQKGDGNEAFFNFNGGTLQARGSTNSFFQSMTRANVRNGGAVINSNGFDITVSQGLQHSNIGGDLSTDGGLRKIGGGALVLTGSSDFTGNTNIDAGTLAIGNGGSLYNGGAIAGSINVNNGGTLRFDRTDTFGNAANTNPVTLTVNAGGNVQSNGQFNSLHSVILNGGTITANGGLFVAGPGSIGAFGFNGTVTANGAVTSTVSNGGGNDNFIRIGREGTNEATSFNVTNSGGILSIGVELRNNFSAASGLTKTGSGKMILNGSGTYTGATTVSAGTLIVNGGISNSSGVSVAAGAKLGGTGSIAASTTVQGTHGVGDGTVGTQSFGGNLTYSGSSSIFAWDLQFSANDTTGIVNGGNAYDKVIVAGNLAGTNGGDATFHILLNGGDFSSPFWSVSRSWNNIFTSPNAFDLNDIFNGFTYSGGANPAGRGTFGFSGATLQWTAVPEPRGVALGALLMGAGLWRRRRHGSFSKQ